MPLMTVITIVPSSPGDTSEAATAMHFPLAAHGVRRLP